MKTLWNLRLLTAFAVSAVTAVPAALAQDADWTPFSSREFQFSVSFCSAPSKDPASVDTKGDLTATLNLFKAITDNYMCLVALADYNRKPDVELELKLNETNFINAIKGTLGTSRRTEFVSRGEKLPALTFTYEMDPDFIGKAIVIIKGARVYMLVFAYHKNKDYTASVGKFLNSFQITN